MVHDPGGPRRWPAIGPRGVGWLPFGAEGDAQAGLVVAVGAEEGDLHVVGDVEELALQRLELVDAGETFLARVERVEVGAGRFLGVATCRV